MERRTFIQSIASSPVILPFSGIGKADSDSGEDDSWELSAHWSRGFAEGELIVVRDGEVEYEREYDSYSDWQKATMWYAQTVADCEYVVDLFGLDIKTLYIDSPYFFSKFKDAQNEVLIQQGKYSDHDFIYQVETHTDGALRGVSGGSDSIEQLVKEVSEKIT